MKQTSINLESYKPLYDRTEIIIYAFLPVFNNTDKSSKYHSLYLTHPDTCTSAFLDGGYCVVMSPPPIPVKLLRKCIVHGSSVMLKWFTMIFDLVKTLN